MFFVDANLPTIYSGGPTCSDGFYAASTALTVFALFSVKTLVSNTTGLFRVITLFKSHLILVSFDDSCSRSLLLGTFDSSSISVPSLSSLSFSISL